jgi:hypothetical protein
MLSYLVPDTPCQVGLRLGSPDDKWRPCEWPTELDEVPLAKGLESSAYLLCSSCSKSRPAQI